MGTTNADSADGILARLGISWIDALSAKDLRELAGACLQVAQVKDGLKPFVVVHEGENFDGPGVYLRWAPRNPGNSADEVLSAIRDTDFDPERETFSVHDLLESGSGFAEIAGSSPSSRVHGFGHHDDDAADTASPSMG